jgi:hypothetical protein
MNKIMENKEKDFLTVIRSADVYFYKKQKPTNQYESDCFQSLSNKKVLNLDLDNHYLYIRWCTGGISGGSCWENGSDPDPHYAITGDKEPEFEDFDKILLAICPNIGYLQYKNVATIIKDGDYNENEYYGNSTNYAYKCVLLRDLFNKLVELKLI